MDLPIVGTRIMEIHWTESTEPGYARYIIKLSSGAVLEVERNGIRTAPLPSKSNSMESDFKTILGGPEIAGVYAEPSGDELAILLRSDHYLLVFGTFDGENTGNNFTLNSPPHEEDWVGEIQRDWRRIA